MVTEPPSPALSEGDSWLCGLLVHRLVTNEAVSHVTLLTHGLAPALAYEKNETHVSNQNQLAAV